jgi:hypothetical protein
MGKNSEAFNEKLKLEFDFLAEAASRLCTQPHPQRWDLTQLPANFYGMTAS